MSQKCPNNGVIVTATTTDYSDGCSCDPIVVERDYFGRVKGTHRVGLFSNNQVVSFKFLWYNSCTEPGVKFVIELLL